MKPRPNLMVRSLKVCTICFKKFFTVELDFNFVNKIHILKAYIFISRINAHFDISKHRLIIYLIWAEKDVFPVTSQDLLGFSLRTRFAFESLICLIVERIGDKQCSTIYQSKKRKVANKHLVLLHIIQFFISAELGCREMSISIRKQFRGFLSENFFIKDDISN